MDDLTLGAAGRAGGGAAAAWLRIFLVSSTAFTPSTLGNVDYPPWVTLIIKQKWAVQLHLHRPPWIILIILKKNGPSLCLLLLILFLLQCSTTYLSTAFPARNRMTVGTATISCLRLTCQGCQENYWQESSRY